MSPEFLAYGRVLSAQVLHLFNDGTPAKSSSQMQLDTVLVAGKFLVFEAQFWLVFTISFG